MSRSRASFLCAQAVRLSLVCLAAGTPGGRERRMATCENRGCADMSQFINESHVEDYHVTLATNSISACQRWTDNVTKSEGILDESCVSGLIGCLSVCTVQCYYFKRLYGHCNSSLDLILTIVAEECPEGKHAPSAPADLSCWTDTRIMRDCTGPLSGKSVSPFCVSTPSIPTSSPTSMPPPPSAPSRTTLGVGVTVAVIFVTLVVVVVAVACVINRFWRRICQGSDYGPVPKETLGSVTPPTSYHSTVQS